MSYIKVWMLAIYLLIIGMLTYTCNGQVYCQSVHSETMQRIEAIKLKEKLYICKEYISVSKEKSILNLKLDSTLKSCNENVDKLHSEFSAKLSQQAVIIDTLSNQNSLVKKQYTKEKSDWSDNEARLNKQIHYYKKKATVFSGAAFFLGVTTMFLLQSK